MLINNQLASTDTSKILQQLEELPSTFPHFRSVAYSRKQQEKSEIREFLHWNVSKEDENHYLELAKDQQELGTLAQYKSDLEVKLMQNQDDERIQKLANRLALAAVYRLEGEHYKAVEQYSDAYSLLQGKVDYEAHRVEQHEVGFSNNEKLGTDNVQDCVTVILHDPITKMTALGHLDISTDKKSITKDMLSRFPENTQLNSYIVGGRQRDIDWVKERSDKNIKEVVEELNKHHNINIKASDIGDKRPPSAIVFDPITAKLEHAVPGKIDENSTIMRQAIVATGMYYDRLNPFLDLTMPKEYRPVPMMAEEHLKFIVQSYLNLSPSGLVETWENNIRVKPLAKAVEKINNDNPELVKKIFTEHIESNVNQLRMNNNKKQKIRTRLLNETNNQLLNANKEVISNIKSNISLEQIKSKEKEDKHTIFSIFKNKIIDLLPTSPDRKSKNTRSEDIEMTKPISKVESTQGVDHNAIATKFQIIKANHEKKSPVKISSKITSPNRVVSTKNKDIQVTRL